MANDIKISRELAERLCKRPGKESLSVNHADILDRGAAQAELRALLAAPAVERQEPVAWQYRVSAGPATGWSLWHDGKGEEFRNSYQVETRALYTSQPAPVAVPEGWQLVPIEPTERMIRRGDQNYSWSVAKIYAAMIEAAPACLDKVKELNQ